MLTRVRRASRRERSSCRPAPGAALTHYSPPEQLTQTPLPLYAETGGGAHAKAVNLYYKGTGMEQFKRVAMFRYKQGFAYQVSCNDVFEPQVQYYIEAVGSDGGVVGAAGSAAEPITVPVVASRTQAEPALPGAPSPASCAAAECPPDVAGCEQPGTGGIGDCCSADKECQSGLHCDDDVCMLKGGAAPRPARAAPTRSCRQVGATMTSPRATTPRTSSAASSSWASRSA